MWSYIFKDRIFSNVKILESLTVPVVALDAGETGNILLNTDDNSFYGRNQTEWVKLNNSNAVQVQANMNLNSGDLVVLNSQGVSPYSYSQKLSPNDILFAARPAFTHDSTRIVYTAFENFSSRFLHVQNLDTNAVTKVVNTVVNDFAITLDDQFIVYTSKNNLYSVPITGGTPVQLNVGNVSTSNFAVSNDSIKIVYLSNKELFSVNIDGTGHVKISGGNLSDTDFAIANNNQVVYRASKVTSGTYELYIVNMDGTGEVQLSSGNVSTNTFSPGNTPIASNNSKIVYIANDELFSVNLNGTGQTKINVGTTVTRFTISPDSKMVVYVVDNQIYSVPINGGSSTNISAGNTSSNRSPIISPDSKTVVYRCDCDINNYFELFSVSIHGGISIKLNENLVTGGDTQFNNTAFITPDSQTVIFPADKDVDGVVELYSVSINGGVNTKLNHPLQLNEDVKAFGNEFNIAISPDSTSVAFIAGDVNDYEYLYVNRYINGVHAVGINQNTVSAGQTASIIFDGLSIKPTTSEPMGKVVGLDNGDNIISTQSAFIYTLGQIVSNDEIYLRK